MNFIRSSCSRDLFFLLFFFFFSFCWVGDLWRWWKQLERWWLIIVIHLIREIISLRSFWFMFMFFSLVFLNWCGIWSSKVMKIWNLRTPSDTESQTVYEKDFSIWCLTFSLTLKHLVFETALLFIIGLDQFRLGTCLTFLELMTGYVFELDEGIKVFWNNRSVLRLFQYVTQFTEARGDGCGTLNVLKVYLKA